MDPNAAPAGQAAPAAAAPKADDRDYLDKGLDAVQKKYGKGKIDPAKNRATNEKITDGIRSLFQKVTGKKVPAKFSN